MNSLINFDYQERPVRVITDEDGATWWVARDVCEVLGLTNPTKAIQGLDEDEVNTLTIGEGIVGPGNPNMNVINESGLYTLLIRSNKKEAKPFRKWITSEVLPSLRKTGQYTMPGADVPLSAGDEVISVQRLSEVAQGIKAAMIMARAFGYRDYEARIMANRLVKKMTGIDAIELLEIPPVPEIPEQVDIYKEFVRECLTPDPLSKINATVFYDRFVTYCNDRAVPFIPSQKAFGMAIQKYVKRDASGRIVMYLGVRIM
jgi:prophage antirepressor-like protein